jgi:hypothetical protein
MMQKPSLTIVSWSLKGLTPKTLLTGTWSWNDNNFFPLHSGTWEH